MQLSRHSLGSSALGSVDGQAVLKSDGQGQLESWTSGEDQQPALWAGRGRDPVVGRQTGLMGR